MNLSIKILVLTLFVSLLGMPIVYGSVTYKHRYYAYGGDGFLKEITIDVAKSAVYVGHAGRRSRFCEAESDMDCVDGVVISFYVPKKKIHVGMKWSGGGHVFEAIREDAISLLGVKISLFVIAKKGGSTYYFSPSSGLVGLSIRYKSFVTTYFASELPGFLGAENSTPPYSMR